MAPANKCSIFASIVVLTNWNYTISFNRPAGLTSLGGDFVLLPLAVAFIAAPFLLVRSYRFLRICLAHGVTIPRERKFVDWKPCVLLFPTLIHYVGKPAVGIAHDGATYTRTFSYGSDASGVTLIASVLLIALYQFYAGLKLATE